MSRKKDELKGSNNKIQIKQKRGVIIENKSDMENKLKMCSSIFRDRFSYGKILHIDGLNAIYNNKIFCFANDIPLSEEKGI